MLSVGAEGKRNRKSNRQRRTPKARESPGHTPGTVWQGPGRGMGLDRGSVCSPGTHTSHDQAVLPFQAPHFANAPLACVIASPAVEVGPQ